MSTFNRFKPHTFAFRARVEACMTETKRPVANNSVRSSKEADET
ncbi:hypothetical protein APY03_3552 [Variovorax sp. WDL1]|nr:hypothetical protein APY03_3552 [Variovorax sp. WDL1]